MYAACGDLVGFVPLACKDNDVTSPCTQDRVFDGAAATFDYEMIIERDRAINGDGDRDIINLAEKFKDYDMVVVAAPYWDMMFPSVLKVYYEHIAVSGITFTYGGKEDDFLFFLNALVRDYLAVDDPAKLTKGDFVDKVESGAA